MKKNLLFVVGAVCSVVACPAIGAYNCYQIAQSSEYLCNGALSQYQITGVRPSLDMLGGGMTMPGCASSDYFECWAYTSGSNTVYVPWYDCDSCMAGYTRKSTTAQMGGCGNARYYYCEENCTGCSNCTSDTTWSATGTAGYEKKVTRTCSCNTCNASTSYRCAAGYYGSSTNGTSGCARCPSSGGVYGTSAAGSTAITSCYIPSGTSMTDSVGTYEYTSNCYYSE